jgi:hypothetical protein
MSVENVSFELQNGTFPTPSTTPVKVINVEDATYDGLCVYGYIGGAPGTYAVASAGYTSDFALACTMVDTVNGDVLYNTGTVAAPTWTTLK